MHCQDVFQCPCFMFLYLIFILDNYVVYYVYFPIVKPFYVVYIIHFLVEIDQICRDL